MNRKQRGELSELAFIYKATGLGFHVSKPYGDSSRYDFIVEHLGRLSKIQVKSTAQLFPSGGYYLNCQRRMKRGTYPYLSGEVDFFAAHVVPHDTWYIFPLDAIANKYYVRFFPHQPARDRRFGPYREAWHLLEGFRDLVPDVIPWIGARDEAFITDPPLSINP
jgi:hypothetical protein